MSTENQTTNNAFFKQFRVYRPNKQGNGFASSWQLSYKPNNKYDKYNMFLVMAKQTGVDENDNASFDWKGGVTVKLGENDIGEILAVAEGRKEAAGYKGSLFHQTQDGGNKVIKFVRTDNGYSLSVSAQNKEKVSSGNLFQTLSDGEVSILTVLLKKAIETIYGW